MVVDGMFKNWEINKYFAKYDDYILWIGIGPSYMKDEGDKPLLHGLSWWEKRQIWKELMKENHRRSYRAIQTMRKK